MKRVRCINNLSIEDTLVLNQVLSVCDPDEAGLPPDHHLYYCPALDLCFSKHRFEVLGATAIPLAQIKPRRILCSID